MTGQPVLAIVRPKATGSTARLAEAVRTGASDPAAGDIEVRVVDALQVGPEHVLDADGFVLCTSENFGYMSGALKHCLEQVYYPLLEDGRRRPWALVVMAGTDGTGAVSSVQRIVSGLEWTAIAEPLLVRGDVDDDDLRRAHELGQTFAAGLSADLW